MTRHQSKILSHVEFLAPGASLSGRGTRREADPDNVRRRLSRIADLVKAGLFAPAQEACADLLFDFQPLIASDPELLASVLAMLEQCGAAGLRRRLLMAVRGDPSARTAGGIAARG
jgi:hypothetical protein